VRLGPAFVKIGQALSSRCGEAGLRVRGPGVGGVRDLGLAGGRDRFVVVALLCCCCTHSRHTLPHAAPCNASHDTTQPQPPPQPPTPNPTPNPPPTPNPTGPTCCPPSGWRSWRSCRIASRPSPQTRQWRCYKRSWGRRRRCCLRASVRSRSLRRAWGRWGFRGFRC